MEDKYKSIFTGEEIDRAIWLLQQAGLDNVQHFVGLFPDTGARPKGKNDGDFCFVGPAVDADQYYWNGQRWTAGEQHVNILVYLDIDQAEHDRREAELARTIAEDGRVQAEQARVQEEIKRVQRAEEDHEIADGDHTRAEQDHTRATTDHGTAVEDHTRAEQDHTRATGDHGTAVEDHTRAEQDHTTATGDHTIAVDDHGKAQQDHTTATGDHTIATGDHTTAVDDHGKAAADHKQALIDHEISALQQGKFEQSQAEREAVFEASEQSRAAVFEQTEAAREEATAIIQQEAGRLTTVESDVAAIMANRMLVNPTGMTVECPTSLTIGNQYEHYINARLLPASALQNIMYISDNKAVSVEPDGRLIINGVGHSLVHVIPTQACRLYKTVGVTIHRPYMRKVGTRSLRFLSDGTLSLT